MPTSDKEQRARELYAAEFERDGWKGKVREFRDPDYEPGAEEQRALRAIIAALPDEQPAQGEVRERVAQWLYERDPISDQESDPDGRPLGKAYDVPWASIVECYPDALTNLQLDADKLLRLLTPPADPAVEEEQQYRVLLAAAIEATKDQATRHYIDKVLDGKDCFVRVSEATAAASKLMAYERERCAREAEVQAEVFLSPEYATGQPLSSLSERTACAACAAAIRALPTTENSHG